MPNAAGLYYFVHGVENVGRPAVILIHGAGGTHLNWPPQIRRLPGQRILAIDLPGHGNSKGIGRQTIQDYAGDMIEFMKAVSLRAAVMIGHSMGGGIALSLALDHSQGVLGLGLIGSAAKLRVARSILDRTADPSTFQAAVHQVTETSYARSANPRLKELAEQRMAETRPTVLHGDFLACDSFNLLDELPRVHAPTLILCGQEDQMTPLSHSQSLRDGISGSRLRVIANAGHMLMLERPDEVADALGEFLDDLPYRPGG